MSRVKNSIINFSVALVGQGIGLIVSFIARIFFIRILGGEYLGLNGLFTNILTVLSLAELGVGNAIIYSLYKPIAENDTEKCKSLMRLYKRFYTIIGIVVLVAGALVTPFLDVFIKEMPQINNIEIIYLLFVLNTSVSYFFSYKRNLIIANQSKYIATIYRYVFYVLLNVAQIIYLVVTKEYLGFLILQVLFTFLENVFVSRKAEKMYPYLKEKNVSKLDEETKKSITTNVKALMLHKIGYIVVSSTDNIILSAIVGLNAVGIYSNYYMITNAINIIAGQVFNAITASTGNLCAVESVEKQKQVFKNINFLNFWIFSFATICLLILFNPFIEIWVGSEYLLPMSVVIVLAINFYMAGVRNCILTFREAKGLFYKDRYKSVIEALINLVVSIILAKQFGILGVFIGTTISFVLTCLWVEPYILFKDGFKSKPKEYFLDYFKKISLTFLVGGVLYYITSIIHGNLYLVFTIKLVICVLTSNIIYILLYRKTPEFNYFYHNIIKKIWDKIVQKLHKKDKAYN